MPTNKEKTIPQGKYRVIKIGKDALYEALREYINKNTENFFDVSDPAKIVKLFDIDWDKGEFICVARSECEENEYLKFDIDTEKLMKKLQNTTESMYVNDRYIELTEEINNL